MKKEMRTLLAAGAFVVAGAVTAQAADITPVTGHWTKLGADYSALVYYIDEPDGFHVVVTTQQGRTSRAAVERFETVLAAIGRGLDPACRGRSAGADCAQQCRQPPAHRRIYRRRCGPLRR